jgi:His/Glu/Gln/Arg/opine family amino acid ABC transporter permease subunit
MLDTSLSWNDILFLLRGASVTLSLTAWAVLGGTALGLVFGIVRASGPIWASSLLGAVLDVFRSIPLLIQFVLINSFKSILGLDWSALFVAGLTLSIYTAAYCTEVVRSGVLAVPKSTRRAARSLGMTYTQDLTSIVFPMATRVMLPSWIGLTLGVMKDTALVLWIGIVELLRASQTIITRIQEPMLVLAVAGLLYFLMSYPLARLGARLERKWKRQ